MRIWREREVLFFKNDISC